MTFSLKSAAFSHLQEIPTLYTCEGEDISPPLSWSAGPAGIKSFALIMDDPDAPDPLAPTRTWVHWVLYNLAAEARSLPEAAEKKGLLPPECRPGLNDWHRTVYGGPCPPIGRHRYFFKLYALDTLLAQDGVPSKSELEVMIQGHILAKAELIGTYQKKKR